MSAECLRAAAASRESTVRARQPALARSALTITSTAVSAGRLATFGGALGFLVLAAGGLAGLVGTTAVGVGSATAFSDGVGMAPGPALSEGTFAGTPVSLVFDAFLPDPPPSIT